MCGRYVTLSDLTWEHYAALLVLATRMPPSNFQPRYNAAPTQYLPVARLRNDETREIAFLKWGLVPSWAKDPKDAVKAINARAETISVKPTFRSAFSKRRCLVLADGFYEWAGTGSQKQPYYIRFNGSAPLAFAGLWDSWRSGQDDPLETFTIITTEANSTMAAIHDRQPVMLAADQWNAWLSAPNESEAKKMLHPCASEAMEMWPVGKAVGNVRNDNSSLRDRITIPNEASAG